MASGAKQKVVTNVIKLLIKAGQAKPAPPVGPALGQAGLNIMSFCKDFNAKTADIKVLLWLFIMRVFPHVALQPLATDRQTLSC